MSSQLLTCIELPFLLALCHKEDRGSPDSGYVRPQGSAIPYPPRAYEDSEADFTDPEVRRNCARWAIDFLNELVAHYCKSPGIDAWQFSHDDDLQETQCNEYHWLGMWIISPYLEPTNHQHKHLQEILEILNKKVVTFAGAETRLKLSFMPRRGTFTLDQLKGIASMLWVTDPLLSKLHPPHCGPSSPPSLGFQFTNIAREQDTIDLETEIGLGVLVEDPWSERLSWHRRPLRVMPHPGELSEGKFRPGLDKIHETKSIPDLLHLLDLPAQDTHCKYKFHAAYNFQNANHPTQPWIELSQHCGTLHGPAIMDWIAICEFIIDPPLPSPDSSLLAQTKVLRQRIDQGFTVFECLGSDGLEAMRYYTQREEPFQVPDLVGWPIRTRPILKYDQEPGPTRIYTSLEDVELEAYNWTRYTKGVEGAGNCNYSFGVELEMLLPSTKRPTKNLASYIYDYQSHHDVPDEVFSAVSQKLRPNPSRNASSVKARSRQASLTWSSGLRIVGSRQASWDNQPDCVDLSEFYTIPVADQMDIDSNSVQEVERMELDPIEEEDRRLEGMDIDPESDDDTPEPDPHPTDSRAIAHGTLFPVRAYQVAGIISSLGHPAYYICIHSFRSCRPWKREIANRGLFHVGDLKLQYHAWSLEQDGSLPDVFNWKGYHMLSGLELISPIYQDTPECWESVADVVGGLPTNLRVHVSLDCGLHVHVGKGQQLLPIHLLRKIYCLMCCVENIVFSLCHPRRRYMTYSTALMHGADRIVQYMADVPPHPELKQHVPKEIGKYPLLWNVLKRMWAVRDLYLLKDVARKVSVSIGHCSPCSAQGVVWANVGEEAYVKGTVEFRHMEGTLDPDLVLRWGQLAVALFQFADLAKPDAWQKLISTGLKCESSTNYDLEILRDFLQQLGLAEDFAYWKNRIHELEKVDKEPTTSDGDGNSTSSSKPDAKLMFAPRVSDERMRILRDRICRRDRTPPYLAQEQGGTDEEL
ncbi:hypothetical protein ACHAPT_003675 [Fusarium lateritium]